MGYDIGNLHRQRQSWLGLCHLPLPSMGMTLEDVELSDASRGVLGTWVDKVVLGGVIAGPRPWCGRGVILLGKPGSDSKTQVAQALLQELLVSVPKASLAPHKDLRSIRYAGYYANTSDLVAERSNAMDSGDSEMLHRIQATHVSDPDRVRVLVLDEVGRESLKTSDWVRLQLYETVMRRFHLGYPTIFATTVETDQWLSAYGDGLASLRQSAFLPEIYV